MFKKYCLEVTLIFYIVGHSIESLYFPKELVRHVHTYTYIFPLHTYLGIVNLRYPDCGPDKNTALSCTYIPVEHTICYVFTNTQGPWALSSMANNCK